MSSTERPANDMNSSTTPTLSDATNGVDSSDNVTQDPSEGQSDLQRELPTTSAAPSSGSQLSSNPQTPAPITILSLTSTRSNPSPALGRSSTLNFNSPSSTSPAPPSTPDVDPQIIEALKSKDRIYVLKLGEQMESLIKEKRQRADLSPATTYQRLLVHRCSAYYKLTPETDQVTKNISVLRTPDSRIPERRICELVPPAESSSTPPAFKIMRRSQGDRRHKPHSQAGSVAGEDGDLSDVEASEAGSLRSSATGSSKKHKTIEEREAAYNEARSRIFNKFDEQAKEKDMSASTSSLSLNSASASSANGDSLGDLDGSIGSPTTESEWSGPTGQYSRDRKDHSRRGNASASSSTRSMRSGYHGNHSNPSSRNSRASSPSFKYASLYEPTPSQQLYDPNQPPSQVNTPYGTQYFHPFAPPPPGYMPPYPGYYPPYPGYPPPHDPHHPPPDPSRPMEQYPPSHMGYPYIWHPPNQPPPVQPPSLIQPVPMQPHQPHHGPAQQVASPPQSPAQYPYGTPPGYVYPGPGYYPPPAGQHNMGHPTHPPSQMAVPGQIYEATHSAGGPHGAHPLHLAHSSSAPPPSGHTFNQNGKGGLVHHYTPFQPPNGRNNQRSPSVPQPNHGNGNKARGNPAIARNPWSYGPGVGTSGGYSGPPSSGSSDIVGPRLTSARRQSNLSGGSSRASSYNDDGLSTTSSSTTTSSSSRRTYTSTTSSQHPLPARPDWAVGLKAQPTLARGSHEHNSPRNPMSPPRGMNGNNAPPILQPTDFPPLCSGPLSEKRNPVPTGAWGNASNRAILVPPGSATSADGEKSSTDTSPKGEAHKVARHPNSGCGSPGKEYSDGQVSSDSLIIQMQVLSIEEKIADIENRAAAQSDASPAAAATTVA